MIVLDASAVIELLLATPTGRRVAARIAPLSETLHAPHLMDLEVVQVLRRYNAAGALSDERAIQALEDLADLDIARYAHDVFVPRVWEMRRNVTAYDAVYLALAETLGGTLLTMDARLANAPGSRARIQLMR